MALFNGVEFLNISLLLKMKYLRNFNFEHSNFFHVSGFACKPRQGCENFETLSRHLAKYGCEVITRRESGRLSISIGTFSI